ncbi:MAG TPA: universal stress protein [Methylomirabilota bacterium]|nr:universal stress protein [Methylomirabilota bacterium]
MTKRILAPMDGRERNEAIVPVVAALARENGATVRLLRIFPVPDRVIGTHGRTVAYADQEMARLTGEGLDELAHVEAALDLVPVETVVRFGDPVDEIVLEAEAFDADLIALVASQRNRVSEALAPGVTARVARKARVPTLVLQER